MSEYQLIWEKLLIVLFTKPQNPTINFCFWISPARSHALKGVFLYNFSESFRKVI